MRVRLFHDTIRSGWLKSLVVQSSLMDGQVWREIDRKTDNKDFMMTLFAVSKPTECRSIRMTQTAKNRYVSGYLRICAFEIFEIFGTLVG
jgi:hypothetical protein